MCHYHHHTATIAQSSAQSTNIVLSAGAPSFGGGGSFETLDFSLPSYDQATSGGDITKPSSSPAPAPSSFDEDAAAKAAAKEEAKRAAEEEKAAKKQAEADAKEAKKQAEAEAKAAAEKEAAEKQAKKEAAEKAKEERKVIYYLFILMWCIYIDMNQYLINDLWFSLCLCYVDVWTHQMQQPRLLKRRNRDRW